MFAAQHRSVELSEQISEQVLTSSVSTTHRSTKNASSLFYKTSKIMINHTADFLNKEENASEFKSR